MGGMGTGVLHCLYFTVSFPFRNCRLRLQTFFGSIRYPANIPEETAVPRWAYYDVTVSDTPAIS